MRWIAIAPLSVVLVLCMIFLARLQQGGATSDIPSPLIGQPAPPLALTALEPANTPLLTNEALNAGNGTITLLNVWASWCGPCRVEHPQIEILSKLPGISVVGVNYKDDPVNAVAFLNQLGNPYTAIGADQTGATAIELGVYGVPETFLLDQDGIIRGKIVGPVTQKVYQEDVLPMIEKMRK